MQTMAKRRSRDAQQARTRLQDILSAHECYKGSYQELTDKFVALKQDFNIPQYQWSFLNGYMAARVDSYYRYKLAFGYIIDGVVYPQKWDSMSDDHKELARQNKLVSNHYWKDKEGNISNKQW